MKVFLIVFSFIFFSFLSAEEFASAQNQSTETTAVEQPAQADSEASGAGSDQEVSVTETKESESPASDVANTSESSVKHETEVIDEQGYDLKLRTLEEKINSLKDKIFRSKQKLAVLQETVVTGTLSTTSVRIVHKNTVGNLFRLTSAIFYLDDSQIFEQTDSPEALETKEFNVYESAIVPGSHNLSVFYIFEGKGYGIFSYLKTYQFKLNEKYPFEVEEGNFAEVIVTPIDKGSSYNFNNRLKITFNMNQKRFDATMDENGGAQSDFATVSDQLPFATGEKNAAVALIHKNTVGGLFKLISASYSFDGVQVYSQIDAPEALEAKEINIYEDKVAAGRHIIKANCIFRGNGYGIFSYMKGYTFNLNENYSFKVEKDNKVEVVVSLEDKGGSYNVNHRLHLSFSEEQKVLESPETESNEKATAQEE